MKNSISALACIAFGLFLTGCSQKKDLFSSEELKDYVSLAPGKSITYRLDSLKFQQFGQQEVTISYQAKDVIDAAITDNTGRPAWRVIRYLRDTLGIGPWVPQSTYMVIQERETLEVVENNLRFQKLMIPVKDGFMWRGNSHIDTYSVHSDVRYMDEWDYTYEEVGTAFPVFSGVIENTITVNQRDEDLGTPNNPDAYSERNYSKEVYAKGIGLIYKDFVHWVFQPRNSTYPDGYKEGYGIRLRMIEHN
ncbi:MAG: hypothetical protein H7Y27_15695 [Gemmatimonadaceae bacterium]|nr:hypothetical protein [Chitinophagaceae bacterium]